MTEATSVTPRTRRVDWLELFFDLVFVVIVKQLTDRLHGEPSAVDFVIVAGLLAVSWMVWLNVTIFSNVSDTQRGQQIATLVSMAGVGLIAVSIPDALVSAAPLLALGLAIPRLAMWPLWLMSRRRRKLGLLRPTLFGPGVALLWIVSLLVPENVRPWVWLGLLVLDVVVSFSRMTHLPYVVSHIIERAGLFIMIVLGESVVEIILAVTPDQSAIAWVTATVGFLLICRFFMMSFRTGTPIAERVLDHRSNAVLRDVIGAGHYVRVLGLIGVAAGLGAAIEHADDGHLPFPSLVALCGGVAAFYLADAFIGVRYGLPVRVMVVLAPLSIVVPALLLLLGRELPPWIIVAVLIADTVLHVTVGTRMSRKIPGNDEAPPAAAGSAS